MNDRAVSLFEQYDIEVVRTRKGRGSILCESKQGLFTLKEFTGSKEKAELMDTLLMQLQEKLPRDIRVEMVLKNKENELLTEDTDGTKYIVKSWFDGRECNVKDRMECEQVVALLAGLHNNMSLNEMADTESGSPIDGLPVYSLEKEYERHTKELKRVRRFLKEKSQKTDFEIFLNRHFDFFMEQAKQVQEDYAHYAAMDSEQALREYGHWCHGDYQHHNIIVANSVTAVINFDKLIIDYPVRDLYLFMRKLLEKSDWSCSLGERLLSVYEKVRPLSAQERISLYYRFAYPEKFWKIVNFYYNSRKSWIPGKNMEKLENVLAQEKEKQQFLDEVLRKV